MSTSGTGHQKLAIAAVFFICHYLHVHYQVEVASVSLMNLQRARAKVLLHVITCITEQLFGGPRRTIVAAKYIGGLQQPVSAQHFQYHAGKDVMQLCLCWCDNANQPPLCVNRLHNSRYKGRLCACLLYTSPSPRDRTRSRMPSSA